MYIPRAYEPLSKYLPRGKVLVLTGPRQVGKTTLVRRYLDHLDARTLYVLGDDVRAQATWSSMDLERLQSVVEGYHTVVIDEAQRIPNVGISLKLLVDARSPVRLIVTGSSSFDLAGQTGEPLTGRKRSLVLLPISQSELLPLHNRHELREQLESRLVFGSYPEVEAAGSREERIATLDEITGSYLLKDILELDRIRSAKTLLDLLRLIAFQVGSEVSLRELGTQVGLDSKTVARYLDLLEKGFVLYNVRGYSRNLRKEITKKSKFYFYDNGIRNALIASFNGLELRDDVGALWENFLFAERLKHRTYNRIGGNAFFWRTWEGQEIDLVEEREGALYGYEFKWGERAARRRAGPPAGWRESYPHAHYEVITPENYLDFVT